MEAAGQHGGGATGKIHEVQDDMICRGKGFTLIEMVAAVLLIAMIAAMSIFAIRGTTSLAVIEPPSPAPWLNRVNRLFASDVEQAMAAEVGRDHLILTTRALHPSNAPESSPKALYVTYQIDSLTGMGKWWVRLAEPVNRLSNAQPERTLLCPAKGVELLVQIEGQAHSLPAEGLLARTANGHAQGVPELGSAFHLLGPRDGRRIDDES